MRTAPADRHGRPPPKSNRHATMPSEAQQQVVLSILRGECGLCHRCLSHLCRRGPARADGSGTCTVCFGIFDDGVVEAGVTSAVTTSARPYGGLASNPITKESPTVVLPAVLMVRAYAAICAAEIALKEAFSSDVDIKEILQNHVDFYDEAKDHVRSLAKTVIFGMKDQEVVNNQNDNNCVSPFPYADITREMDEEEAGYLGIHMAFVPVLKSDDSGKPSADSDQNDGLLPEESILKTRHILNKRDRKRFRGNDPTPKQGGDPKVNLLKRIKAQGMAEKNDIQRILDDVEKKNNGQTKKALAKWLIELASTKNAMHSHSTHASVWRKSFYVKGKYTKAGRTISQTPFYVPDGAGGKMIRKGDTSVEEEISAVLELGCGGISCQNNEFVATTEENSDKAGAVVFGLCKFHASGREDLDVRMLLPPIHSRDNSHIGGRPFVCEVIDAFRLPSSRQLSTVMNQINRIDIDEEPEVSDIVVDADITPSLNHNPLPSVQSSRNRRYGRNPNGVDVANLSHCTSADYKGLQGETEHKVKHYGCAVWCETPIKSQEDLDERLGVHTAGRFPMEIQQSTPLRVLHRRAAAVRSRHVLTLSAQWVDEHWFGLHLSTTAGTYVKEFVHGDCGRTSPSISSILGCKTDIVRLDCEGIAM